MVTKHIYTKMLNVIIVAGNATQDPTVRNTATGKKIVTVRLAVNNPLNDDEVLYIDIDAWDKQADFAEKFVKKGSSLSAVGRLKSRDFVGKDGLKRVAYSVVCDRLNFIGGKKKDANAATTVAAAVAAATDAQSDEFDDAAFAQAAGIK